MSYLDIAVAFICQHILCLCVLVLRFFIQLNYMQRRLFFTSHKLLFSELRSVLVYLLICAADLVFFCRVPKTFIRKKV